MSSKAQTKGRVPHEPQGNAVRKSFRRQPRLVLTPRGRRVFATLFALPVATGLILGAQNATAGDDVSGVAFEQVTVGAGQTLWSLANELAPGADPRDVIADIASLNQLKGTAIQPGQRLAIPAAYSK